MSVQDRTTPGERGDDPDLAGADAALRRAARRVRQEAAAAGRAVEVFQDGEIVREKPGQEHLPQGRRIDGDDR